MKIDLNNLEIWNLLKEGTTTQRNFINSLTFTEFNEFLEQHELFFEEYDIRGLLNGGCLFVEDTPEDVEEEHIIYENGRISITLY